MEPEVNNPEIIVLIPAAGSSSRIGVGLPKPLLTLGGKTILERAISPFLNNDTVQAIVIAAPALLRKRFEETVEQAFPSAAKPIRVIDGGATRQESVRLGLNQVSNLVRDRRSTFILIHDCARCLVSSEIIEKTIQQVIKSQAVTVAVPVVDTIKRADPDRVVVDTLNRAELWQIQTPQAFRLDLITDAHQLSEIEVTDDASLVEKLHPVKLVIGDRINFKVTTPEDLLLAEMILAQRNR